MDEKDFEIILCLRELGNITKVSERLFLTQPALTSRIKRIEKELGTELLLRTRKGVTFTPVGEVVVDYARRANVLMDQMRSYVRMNTGRVGGTVRLGIAVNYAQHKLPRPLKQYITDYPGVEVKILADRSTPLYKLLLQDEVDVAVLRGEFAWNEGKEKLCSEPLCLVSLEQIPREELKNNLYVGYRSDAAFVGHIDTWRKHNVGPSDHKTIWVDSIDTCLAMVKGGIGWTVLPEICLGEFQGCREPVYFPDGRPILRDTCVFYRNAHYTLPQVKLFIRYLRKYAENRPDTDPVALLE